MAGTYIVTPRSAADVNQLASLLHSHNVNRAWDDEDNITVGNPMVVFLFSNQYAASNTWYGLARLDPTNSSAIQLDSVNDLGTILQRG